MVVGCTWFDFTLAGLYLGAFGGLFGMLLTYVWRRTRLPLLLTAPFLWVTVEYLRAHAGFLGVPWALLGHSQYRNLPFIQIADMAGVYGLSFIIVVVNVTVYEALCLVKCDRQQEGFAALRARCRVSSVVAGMLLLFTLSYGNFVLHTPTLSQPLSVSVVQGNIPQHEKWQLPLRDQHLEHHMRLTRQALAESTSDLIVWPESSTQGFLPQDFYLLNFFALTVQELKVPLLIGGTQHLKTATSESLRKRRLNSAFLISPTDGMSQSYNKVHLLPFGEYLPYPERFFWPTRVREMGSMANFVPGEDRTVFALGRKRFGVLLCWESLFPELARQLVKDGAQFIINMSNEAWFGDTAAPQQFFMMNVFRAVENRVAVVRCANSGISGFIDPHGRILGQVEEEGKNTFVAGYLTATIPLTSASSFYVQHGDLWAYVNIAMTLVLLVLASVGWPWRSERPLGDGL